MSATSTWAAARHLVPGVTRTCEVRGPMVQAVQFTFLGRLVLGDRKRARAGLEPATRRPKANEAALCLASDPSDLLETCGLFFMHAINSARHRLWIASPYFVPDGSILHALQLAALRGVDVRIMLPEKPDHKLVYLAAFSYIAETELSGVKFYRYQPGFMHHKVIWWTTTWRRSEQRISTIGRFG